MAKFMYIGSYTAEGAKGVLKEGGTARRKMAEQSVASVGGKLESYYFAYGKDDFYVIFEAPGAAEAAALSLTTAATGAIRARTIPLITPEEMDDAAKLTPNYSPPGG
jgi:uncharacterized protein with GYD domain